MPRMDERTPAVAPDDDALGRIASALDRPEVVAGYLIGSQAAGTAGPLSDVDIAVWLDPGLSPDERLASQLRIATAATEALAGGEVDLIVLNDASPLLRHRALGGRRLLLDRDPVARVRLETAAIVEYLDTAPLREELARGLRQRLDEERFGRR